MVSDQSTNESEQPDDSPFVDRRTVLKSAGAATVGVAALSGTASAHEIRCISFERCDRLVATGWLPGSYTVVLACGSGSDRRRRDVTVTAVQQDETDKFSWLLEFDAPANCRILALVVEGSTWCNPHECASEGLRAFGIACDRKTSQDRCIVEGGGDGDNDDDDDGDGDGEVCARTQGYWKTHPEAWPVSSLTLGGTTYTQSELLAILNEPPRGDKTIVLAKQLIAAKLNVAAGTDPSCIRDAIRAADAWLASHGGVGSNQRQWDGGESIKDRLDAYNNGRLCACRAD